ncbi:unnamed protein product [Paramecium sonneborni]|uniref:Uncharacterized protein n=1 Tax=Paramecium sonneborni TaxID=65129 RepID=A0A8S1QYD8_9CILI|nr:unnamed protein product [Paramecium sonneborni]
MEFADQQLEVLEVYFQLLNANDSLQKRSLKQKSMLLQFLKNQNFSFKLLNWIEERGQINIMIKLIWSFTFKTYLYSQIKLLIKYQKKIAQVAISLEFLRIQNYLQ